MRTDTKNTLVHIVFENASGEQCECIGVLMSEAPEAVTVAFSAMQDVVLDSIKIPRSKILSLEHVADKDIQVF